MTPLTEAVEAYLAKGLARFHMPGHKGRAAGLFDQVSEYDVTEVKGTDSLYECKEAIRETERQYAALYESGDCLLSAGGSTLCIQAMLATALRPGEKFLIGRNCHSSAVNAAALCGFEPVWLMKQTPEALEHALSERPGVKAAYLTSPDYFGTLADIAACSKICHEHGALLLVDNARGAHLPFFEKKLHPMHLGADACADSAHKTLPVLTGGAYLQIGNSAPPVFAQAARRTLALFGSTSPSYLILQSLDQANRFLAGEGPAQIRQTAAQVAGLKSRLALAGWEILPGEALKLTLRGRPHGYSGGALAEQLRQDRVEAEYWDPDHLTLMFSTGNQTLDYQRIGAALGRLPKKAPLARPWLALPRPERCLSPRAALFSPAETVAAEAAVGRVLVAPSTGCPPAVPVAVSGERIGPEAAAIFRYYGTERLVVLKENGERICARG